MKRQGKISTIAAKNKKRIVNSNIYKINKRKTIKNKNINKSFGLKFL